MSSLRRVRLFDPYGLDIEDDGETDIDVIGTDFDIEIDDDW